MGDMYHSREKKKKKALFPKERRIIGEMQLGNSKKKN